MERIGIAASKIAKGNWLLYNLTVVLLSFLFSLFIFVLAGSTVVFALVMITYVSNEILAFEFEKNKTSILFVCMISLTIVTVLFNLLAISKNIKFRKK